MTDETNVEEVKEEVVADEVTSDAEITPETEVAETPEVTETPEVAAE